MCVHSPTWLSHVYACALLHTRVHQQITQSPAVSVFNTPPVDIFSSQKPTPDKDDIFAPSSVKQPLKKPDKSLDELLGGRGKEEVDGGEKVGKGGCVYGLLTSG